MNAITNNIVRLPSLAIAQGAAPADALLELWLSSLKTKGLSPKTLKAYAIDVREFLDTYDDDRPVQDSERLSRISAAGLDTYFASFENSAPATRARKVSSLRNFFNWLESRDYILKNPFRQIESPKRVGYSPKPIMLSDYHQILGRIRKSNQLVHPYRLIFMMLAESGHRVGEVLSIDIEDISKTEDGFSIRALGKKGIIQTINILHDYDCYPMLANHLERSRQRGPLFVDPDTNCRVLYDKVYRVWNRHISRDYNLHRLRHTKATELINEVDAEHARVHLGHRDISSTNLYARYSDETYIRKHKAYLAKQRKTPSYDEEMEGYIVW